MKIPTLKVYLFKLFAKLLWGTATTVLFCIFYNLKTTMKYFGVYENAKKDHCALSFAALN